MSDANNKLRLQIITELDNMGIKATQDQVKKLEMMLLNEHHEGIKAALEHEKSFGKLEKAIGNLPGPIGQVTKALGGWGGKLGMIVGAFQTGFAIGEKLRETTVKIYEWAKGLDEVRQLTEFAKQQNKELAEEAEKAAQRQIALYAKQLAAASETVGKIDEQTAAYLRQVASLEGLKRAQGNAEMLQLEREKFENMHAYSIAGYDGAAEQIGKYYDVLEAELAAKQELERFDRESIKLAKEREAAELKAAKAVEATDAAKVRLQAAEDKLASIDRHENGARGGMYAKLRGPQLKVVEDARKQYDKAVMIEERRSAKLEELEALDLQRKMERANIDATGTLNIDRAAKSYDDYVASANNPLGADIDPSWSSDLLQRTNESVNVQAKILEKLEDVSSKFENLLRGS